MKVESEAEFAALKAGFRGGIPDRLGPPPVADAERLFDILLERGGEKLLGPARRFDPDVFWTPPNP
jgi:NitT/TauT family transport system substrate-binding protein